MWASRSRLACRFLSEENGLEAQFLLEDWFGAISIRAEGFDDFGVFDDFDDGVLLKMHPASCSPLEGSVAGRCV